MRLKAMRFGDENFAVTFSDAEEIENLRRTDPAAALALARRKDHRDSGRGFSLYVPLHLTDAVSPDQARMAQLAAGALNMATVTIGDQQIEADPRVAAELGRLRAAAAVRDALPLADRLRLDARDAILAQQAANRDPNTPRGAYAEWLSNAWRTAGANDRV